MIMAFVATVIYMVFWGITYRINGPDTKKKWIKRKKKHSGDTSEPFMTSAADTNTMEMHPMELGDQRAFDMAYVPPFSPIGIELTVGLQDTLSYNQPRSKESSPSKSESGNNSPSNSESGNNSPRGNSQDNAIKSNLDGEKNSISIEGGVETPDNSNKINDSIDVLNENKENNDSIFFESPEFEGDY